MPKKRKKYKYSPISSHKRNKTKLVSPMNQLNMELLQWEKDFLPEHLWIEMLANEFNDIHWHRIYNDFLDKLEESINDPDVMLFGFISDFNVVPEKSREDFIKKNYEFIYNFFYKIIGKALTFYPDNPANWLLLEEWKEREKIDFETELNKVGRSINRLMAAKDYHSGHVRAVPLNRLFKHNKLFIFKDMKKAVDLLPKYPDLCNDDEKYYIQSFARNIMNPLFMKDERYKEKKWAKYFWRQNYNLIPCVPKEFIYDETERVSDDKYTVISKQIEKNCLAIGNYINKLGIQYKYDLYDPIKDEILLGLFSRLSRLYIVYLTGPNLWSRDITGIFLRVYIDTAIIFSFLIQKGTEEDFLNFKNYSEGKEKLLMLHLQDSFKKEKSLENKSIEEIAEDIGGPFAPEFIDIELKGWIKKSSYDLAKICGLEKYYKLVYDPASSDLHGMWTSLKKSNLTYCKMSLHRYHRIPSCAEPPLYLNSINIVTDIFNYCFDLGFTKDKFPKLDEKIEKIVIEK